jgi:hypothetical protein
MQVQFGMNGMNGMQMNMNGMNTMNTMNGMNTMNTMNQSFGSLFIRPVYAQLTHDTDFFSKMSPFIIFANGGQRVKSSVSHGGGKNPKWNDQIQISASSQDRILIELFDHHTFTSNEVVAVGELFVSKVVSMGGNYQDYIPLFYKGKPAGTIMIQAQYSGQQQQQQMGMNTQMNMGGTQIGMTVGGTQMGMNMGMQPTYVQTQMPQQTFVQTQMPQQTFVQTQMPQQTVIQQNGFGQVGFPQKTFVQTQPTIIQQKPTFISGGFIQPTFPSTTVIGGGFGGFGGFGQTEIIQTSPFGGTEIIQNNGFGTTEIIQSGPFGGTEIIQNNGFGTTEIIQNNGFGFGQTEIIQNNGFGTTTEIIQNNGFGVTDEVIINNNGGFGVTYF